MKRHELMDEQWELVSPFVLRRPAQTGRRLRSMWNMCWHRRCAPGDIVVLDKLQRHKSPHASDVIHSAGADLWFLPPYSPDLSPIEMMFSKLKALLGRAKARTAKTLDKALAAVTGTDICGWFNKCGYRYTQT